MAIGINTTDYSGRTIDLHIFQGVHAPGTSSIAPSFGAISNFCSGIQKLIQRYTISLLTEIGSQPNFSAFGSSLIPSLTSTNNIYNRADLIPIFNAANSKIVKEFAAYDLTVTVPDDERLAGASLTGASSVGGNVSLQITLNTHSQTTVNFIVPLPI